MTIYSGIFNSVRDSNGKGDRIYDAWWFAKYFSTFIGNGVFPNPSTNLQVVQKSNMTVTVRPGKGWIEGYFLYSDSDHDLRFDNADGVLKRIDRVVMRLNYVKREIEIDVKKGIFASNPVPPNLQRDTDYHELALADVLITSGTTQITQANITDTRLNNNLCGIVHGTVDQVDTTTIFNQYESWFEQWTKEQKEDFEAWVETLNEILDGDVAGNLANRIFVLEKKTTQMETVTIPNLENEVDNHIADYVLHPGYGIATGLNDYALTLSPNPTSYKPGMGLVLQMNNNSTENCTINVNGLGAKKLINSDGSTVRDLIAGSIYTLRYNGSDFILQGESGVDLKEEAIGLVEVGGTNGINVDGDLCGVSENYLYFSLTATNNIKIDIRNKRSFALVKTIDLLALSGLSNVSLSRTFVFNNGRAIFLLSTNNRGGVNALTFSDELLTSLIQKTNIGTGSFYGADKYLDSDFLYIYTGGNASYDSRFTKMDSKTGLKAAELNNTSYVLSRNLKPAVDADGNFYTKLSSNLDKDIYKYTANFELILTIPNNLDSYSMFCTKKHLYCQGRVFNNQNGSEITTPIFFTVFAQTGEYVYSFVSNLPTSSNRNMRTMYIIGPSNDGLNIVLNNGISRSYRVWGDYGVFDESSKIKFPTQYMQAEVGSGNQAVITKFLGGKLR